MPNTPWTDVEADERYKKLDAEGQKQTKARWEAAQPKVENPAAPSRDGALVQGFKNVGQSVEFDARMATGDTAGATRTVMEAQKYHQANPSSEASETLYKSYDDAQEGGFWDPITKGVPAAFKEVGKDIEREGLVTGIGSNLEAVRTGLVKQLPNMLLPMTGMVAGGLGGAATGTAVAGPGIGTTVGAMTGAFTGASIGNATVEGLGMAQQALEKAGVDQNDPDAVKLFLDENRGDLFKQAAIKGSVIGAVDTATAGAASKLLRGPTSAAIDRAIVSLGVNLTDKVAVATAKKSLSREIAAKVAVDPAFLASKTGMSNVARNSGAAVLDPLGEGTGEYFGQGIATGDYDSSEAFIEAISGGGTSVAMFAGQKGYQKATDPLRALEAPTSSVDPVKNTLLKELRSTLTSEQLDGLRQTPDALARYGLVPDDLTQLQKTDKFSQIEQANYQAMLDSAPSEAIRNGIRSSSLGQSMELTRTTLLPTETVAEKKAAQAKPAELVEVKPPKVEVKPPADVIDTSLEEIEEVAPVEPTDASFEEFEKRTEEFNKQYEDKQAIEEAPVVEAPVVEPAAVEPVEVKPPVVEPAAVEPPVVTPPKKETFNVLDDLQKDITITKPREIAARLAEVSESLPLGKTRRAASIKRDIPKVEAKFLRNAHYVPMSERKIPSLEFELSLLNEQYNHDNINKGAELEGSWIDKPDNKKVLNPTYRMAQVIEEIKNRGIAPNINEKVYNLKNHDFNLSMSKLKVEEGKTPDASTHPDFTKLNGQAQGNISEAKILQDPKTKESDRKAKEGYVGKFLQKLSKDIDGVPLNERTEDMLELQIRVDELYGKTPDINDLDSMEAKAKIKLRYEQVKGHKSEKVDIAPREKVEPKQVVEEVKGETPLEQEKPVVKRAKRVAKKVLAEKPAFVSEPGGVPSNPVTWTHLEEGDTGLRPRPFVKPTKALVNAQERVAKKAEKLKEAKKKKNKKLIQSLSIDLAKAKVALKPHKERHAKKIAKATQTKTSKPNSPATKPNKKSSTSTLKNKEAKLEQSKSTTKNIKLEDINSKLSLQEVKDLVTQFNAAEMSTGITSSGSLAAKRSRAEGLLKSMEEDAADSYPIATTIMATKVYLDEQSSKTKKPVAKEPAKVTKAVVDGSSYADQEIKDARTRIKFLEKAIKENVNATPNQKKNNKTSMEIATNRLARLLKAKNTPKLSETEVQGPTIAHDVVKSAVDKLVGKNSVVNVVESQEELQDILDKEGSQPLTNKSKTAGAYLKGKIYLNSSAIFNQDEVLPLIIHEGGHWLRETDKAFQKDYEQFLEQAKEIGASKSLRNIREAKAFQAAMSKALSKDTNMDLVQEEALMYFLQNEANTEMSLYKRIVSKLKALLFKHFGISAKRLNLSGYDMAQILVGDIKATIKSAKEVRDNRKQSLDEASPDAKYMFIGEGAKGHNPASIEDKFNLTDEELRIETGWFDSEGHWMKELSDESAELIPKYDLITTEYTLEDVLIHPKLYEAYPFLKGLRVTFGNKANGFDSDGMYSPSTKSIAISTDSSDVLGTLLHEVQHAVQHKEGFPSGGSVTDAKGNAEAASDELLNKLNSDRLEWSRGHKERLLDDKEVIKDDLGILDNMSLEDEKALNDLVLQWHITEVGPELDKASRELNRFIASKGLSTLSSIGTSYNSYRLGLRKNLGLIQSDLEYVNEVISDLSVTSEATSEALEGRKADLQSTLDEMISDRRALQGLPISDQKAFNTYVKKLDDEYALNDETVEEFDSWLKERNIGQVNYKPYDELLQSITNSAKDWRTRISNIDVQIKKLPSDRERAEANAAKYSAFSLYENLHGEVMARDVSDRLDFNDEDRKSVQPATQELEEGEAIVRYNSGGAYSESKGDKSSGQADLLADLFGPTDTEMSNADFKKKLARHNQEVADKAPILGEAIIKKIHDEAVRLNPEFKRNKDTQTTNWFTRLLSSPEYYGQNTDSAAGRLVDAAIKEDDVKYRISDNIEGKFAELVKHIKQTNPEAIPEATPYLWDTDKTGKSFSLRYQKGTDLWGVLDRDDKLVSSWDERSQASEQLIEEEQLYLTQEGMTHSAKIFVRLARELTSRSLAEQNKDLQDQIDRNEAAGIEEPSLGSKKLSDVIRDSGDLEGSYMPRVRQKGKHYARLEKDGVPNIVITFDDHIPLNDTKSDLNNSIRTLINSKRATGRQIAKLEAEGYEVTALEPVTTPPDELYDTPGIVAAVDTLVKQSLESVDSGEYKTQLVHLNNLLLKNIGDIYKEKGNLSNRRKRSESYAEGFETDPVKALVSHAQQVSAGIAKRTTTQNMIKAFTGHDLSYADYLKDNPEGNYDGYRAAIATRKIDSTKQKNLFVDMKTYMKYVLEPTSRIGKVFGYMKALAVLKYLGFRPASAAVNMTNMVMGVPATMAAHTGIGVVKAYGHVVSAAGKYTAYRSAGTAYRGIAPGVLNEAKYQVESMSKGIGKTLSKPAKLSDEDYLIFDDIHHRGWDQALFNIEAVRAIQGDVPKSFNSLMEKSMYMFSAAERANRAMTIFAAYQAHKENPTNAALTKDELMDLAKHTSDRAHGTYGKAAKPWIIQKAPLLDLAYTFMKFQHNYILNALEMGVKYNNWKATSMMTVMPAATAGLGATFGWPIINSIAGAMMSAFGLDGDDPEEALYSYLGDNFGKVVERTARHGAIGGALSLNVKGSLAFNSPLNTGTLADLGGAPVAVMQDLIAGAQHLKYGEKLKAAEKFLPSGMGGSLAKAYRLKNEGYTTSTASPKFYGPQQTKANTLEAIITALTFSPQRLAAIQEELWHERTVRMSYTTERGNIMRRYKNYFATTNTNRDPKQLEKINVRADNYNKRVSLGNPKYNQSYLTPPKIVKALYQSMRPSKQERTRNVQ